MHYSFAKILTKKRIKSVFNCGYGKGYSVKNIIFKFNHYLNKKVQVVYKKRRKNDIGYSVADNKKLKKYHDFKNIKSKLSLMIISSYRWYKKINT